MPTSPRVACDATDHNPDLLAGDPCQSDVSLDPETFSVESEDEGDE